MKQLTKGLLYGLAFFLPGVMVLTQGKPIQIFTYFSSLPEEDLPVIQHTLAKDFENGFQLFGNKFRQRVKEFDANQALNHPSLFDYKNTAWSWKKAAIEEKLSKYLGKRQLERRQLFLQYIENHAPLALSEMAQSKIPASVTLAQGLLETNAGNSYIARAARNHFGIKCYKYPNFKADGVINDNDFYPHSLAYDCLQIKDDHVWDRFQVYRTVAASYRHHTLLLSREKRYNWMIAQYSPQLGQNCQVEGHWFGTTEVPYYAAWCIGLKKSGYATGKRYAQKLVSLIETYELWRFDYQPLAGMLE